MTKTKIALALIQLSAVLACRHDVFVSITAPEQLEGADITIDGELVGRLERIASDEKINRELNGQVPRGSIAYIKVPPGAHELKVTKPGYEPIIRHLNYPKDAGEDYIRLEAPERAGSPLGGEP